MKPIKENINKGHRQRMFDKAVKGTEHFADHELLEMFLFCTNPQKNTNPDAHALLKRFKNFKGVMGASHEELQTVDGIGPKAATYIKLLQEMYKRASTQEFFVQKLNTAGFIESFCKKLFAFETVEKLYAICLDSSYNLLSAVELSSSNNISNASINSDEALKKIIVAKAKEVVLMHNHLQSGVIPTQDDIDTTKVLMQKMLGVGIVLRDHIIVNNNEVFSFSAQGWIKLWADAMLSPAQSAFIYSSSQKIASGGVKLSADDYGLKII